MTHVFSTVAALLSSASFRVAILAFVGLPLPHHSFLNSSYDVVFKCEVYLIDRIDGTSPLSRTLQSVPSGITRLSLCL